MADIPAPASPLPPHSAAEGVGRSGPGGAQSGAAGEARAHFRAMARGGDDARQSYMKEKGCMGRGVRR
jgi:hypothetical protein